MAERQTRANGQPTPSEVDAERALVGAAMLGAPLAELRTFLRATDFVQPALGAAYAAALGLEAGGVGIDEVTLAVALEQLPAPAGEGTMLDRLNGRAGLAGLTQECPTIRNASHYAQLIAAAAAERAGDSARPPSIPVPKVERVGLGYRAVFDAGVELKVDRLREHSGELSGELLVRWIRPLGGQDGHISRARQNLSSMPARTSTARVLNSRTAGGQIPWSDILERFCVGVLDAHRAGDAFQLVGQWPPKAEAARILHPILVSDAANLIYAKAGTGKSTLAAALALSVQTNEEVIRGWKPLRAPVLILDWEASADEWNDRIAALAAGILIEPPEIHYRRMQGALADRVEELAAFRSDHGVELIVVDSVGMASGTSREGSDANESALRLFDALRAIGGTSLLVDHVAGAELDKNGAIGKAYGSVYKMNLARAAYELRRENEGTQERTELVLRQAKVNDQGRLAPITLAITYESGSIRIETTRATAPDLMPIATTAAGRIASLLGAEPMKAPAIAEELGMDGELVRVTLNRNRGKLFVKLQDGTWGLVHHE